VRSEIAMTPRLTAATLILLAACESPGSGGRGVFVPPDATGGDATTTTGTSADTSETGDPEDTTTTSAGTDTSFDTGTPEIVVPGECTPLPFSGVVPGLTSLGGGAWSSPQGVNLGLGGAAPDTLMLAFESSQLGTFELAGQTPGTCVRCIQLAVDVGQGGTTYFANAGTIQVLASPMGDLDVVLRGVTLTEVSAGGTILSGGDCLSVAEVRLQGEGEVCQASCAGRVCGDDGCGGTCGAGCQVGQTCTAAGTCTGGTTTGCTTISPTGSIEPIEPGRLALELTSLGLGGADLDYLQLEFYDPATGSFNLATGDNSNYASCVQCLRIFEDATETGLGRQYFQSKGSINIGSSSRVHDDPPSLSVTLTDVELVEVTIQEGTFTSTKVPNGKCLKLSNRTLSTP